MTPPKQEDGADTDRRSTEVSRVTGWLAVLSGLFGLGVIGYWYAADMGWTGTGSTIVEPRGPILAVAFVPAVAVLLGVVVLLIRRDLPARSTGGSALLVTAVVVAAAVPFAVRTYPQVEPATLVSHGDAVWRTELPVTEVFGVTDEGNGTITLEGRVDRRACDWELRAVTVDLATGEVFEVEELPTVHQPSEIPPDPTPLDPARFLVEQGSTPFVCRN